MDDSSPVSSTAVKSKLRPTNPLVALMLLLIPAMLLVLAIPLPPYRPGDEIIKQYWVLRIAIGIAAVAGAGWCKSRSTLWLILMGTALLLIAQLSWGMAYRAYGDAHPEYAREVFRRAMRKSPHAPLYGRYDNAIARWNAKKLRYRFNTLPFVIVSALIAAGWFIWAWRRRWDTPWKPGALLVLMGMQLAMIIAFAACEPWPTRFSLQISGYSEFKKDIPAFTGVRDTLRNYVQRMPTLEWYGQHYPPGNLILLEIEKAFGLPGMTKVIVCVCTLLSVLPLWKLTQELEFDQVATSATLFLFAAGSSVLIYCTINTTSLLLLPGTMCLWLLIRSLKTGSLAPAAGLGFCFAVYLFFSFSASILGVLMALTTLIGLFRGAFLLRNVVRTGLLSLATLACGIAALYLTTRFNLIACFVAAVRGHHADEGYDDPKRWLLRSTGNVIAYLLSIVPLCVLAISALRGKNEERSAKPHAALFIAVIASVLIAGFSGLFYVETERIWIFLTPAFALAAGWALARGAERKGNDLLTTVFLLVLLISCSQEWWFMHYR